MANAAVFPVSRCGQRNGRRAPHLSGIALTSRSPGATMQDDLQKKTIDWFASLLPVLSAEMVGTWRGEGISSGHPLDGLLENLQWSPSDSFCRRIRRMRWQG